MIANFYFEVGRKHAKDPLCPCPPPAYEGQLLSACDQLQVWLGYVIERARIKAG